MKKEKQVCDFGMKHFNQKKRMGVELAPRPSGGGKQKGKPSRTDTTPPGISNITVTGITNGTAAISFTTNEETTATVEYGPTTSYGYTITASGSTTHSAGLTNLDSNTVYNYRIIAQDLSGNITTTSNRTFNTISTSKNVLYLEFYGATVTGTLWNTNGTITAEHSGLSVTEVADVLEKVKAHYANFNVIVTDDVTVYNNTPTSQKQRVIFTQSHQWYGTNAGGVAYIGSWGWSDQSPAWVFTTLLSYNTHYIAEAGAHEAGHVFGLRHQVTCQDGTITSQYNWGDGITAPVMGASYNVPAGDWWIGPNSLGCTNIQDDTQMLIAKIGLSS